MLVCIYFSLFRASSQVTPICYCIEVISQIIEVSTVDYFLFSIFLKFFFQFNETLKNHEFELARSSFLGLQSHFCPICHYAQLSFFKNNFLNIFLIFSLFNSLQLNSIFFPISFLWGI